MGTVTEEYGFWNLVIHTNGTAQVQSRRGEVLARIDRQPDGEWWWEATIVLPEHQQDRSVHPYMRDFLEKRYQKITAGSRT